MAVKISVSYGFILLVCVSFLQLAKSVSGQQEDADMKDCKENAQCIRIPSQCVKDKCVASVTIENMAESVKFTIEFSNDGQQWAAVGLSEDPKMANTAVVYCRQPADKANDAKSNIFTTITSSGYSLLGQTEAWTTKVTPVNVELKDGKMTCVFTIDEKKIVRAGDVSFDLSKSGYILLAAGEVEVDTGDIGKHSVKTSKEMNLSKFPYKPSPAEGTTDATKTTKHTRTTESMETTVAPEEGKGGNQKSLRCSGLFAIVGVLAIFWL